MNQNDTQREPYSPPVLRVFGGIAALTLQGASDGVKPGFGTDCSGKPGSHGQADCS
jgi:hypothetical protein